MSNNFLFDQNPLVIQPKLAECIGLNEAIILQQMNYWLKKSDKYFDGHVWIYNTYKTWNDQFPFFSISTIRRTISNLEKEKIVITGNYNKAGFDKTKWYTIDNDVLTAKINSACVQNEQTECSNWTHGSVQNEHMEVFKMNTPIPETTREYKENTTETTTEFENSSKTSAYKKVVGMFENNGFGSVGGIIATNINDELDDFVQDDNYEQASEVLCKAIEIAVNQGKNKPAYVWGITKNWYQKKLFTVEAIEAELKKNSFSGGYRQPEKKKLKNGGYGTR